MNKHNRNLKNSLKAFKKYLKETPHDEVEEFLEEIDKLNFEGPSIKEYLQWNQINTIEQKEKKSRKRKEL